MTKPIPDHHLQEYRELGYAVVERFFDGEELEGVKADVDTLLPPWPDAKRLSARMRYHQFPFNGARTAATGQSYVDAINAATLDANLVDFIARCLGSEEIILNKSALAGKYPGSNYDQPFHQDYHKYSLVVPSNRPGFGHLQTFIYWEDVTEQLGPTCILPTRFAEGIDGVVARDPKQARALGGTEVRPEDCRPDLYEHEVRIVVPAGSVLVYSTGTHHRGSHLSATEGRRVSQHMVWRCAGNPWNIDGGFVDRGGDPAMIRFLERATPRQRTLLGFPAPGNGYWTDETVNLVQRRYPKMDMSPYRPSGRHGDS